MLTPARRTGFAFAAVALTLGIAGCSGSSSGTHAASSTGASVATASSAPTTVAPGPTRSSGSKKTTPAKPIVVPSGAPAVAVSLAPPVKTGQAAQIRSDVTITVGKIKNVTVKATQPGEIAGPAVAVPVLVRNTSSAPFSLGGMVVTVSYGSKDAPGNQTSSGPSHPLTGSLKAGASARGTYVFNVPASGRASLHVQISSDQAATIVQVNR